MRDLSLLFSLFCLCFIACQQNDVSTKLEDSTVFSDQEKRELSELLHKFDEVVCRLSSKSKISACYRDFIYSIATELAGRNDLIEKIDLGMEVREEILSSLSPSLKNELWETQEGEIKRRVEGSKGTFKDTIQTIRMKFGKFAKYRQFLFKDLAKQDTIAKKYVDRQNMEGYHFNPYYLHTHIDEYDFKNEQFRLTIALQYLVSHMEQENYNNSTDEFYDGIKKAFEDRRRERQKEGKQ